MYKKQTNRIKRGLSALTLSAATFWGVTSADAQIVIDGHFADWDGINAATVDDAKDMADSSGDIRQIQAHVEGGNLHLSMSVHGIAAPSVDDTPEGMKNRYYYHWLFDTDNDTATGFKNDAYEGNPTGLAKPIGVDLVVMIGWRDGKPNGLAAYDPLVGDDSPLVVDFAFNVSGDTISAVIPLSDLKLTEGQSVGFSAFQEGASDGWSVDWVESASVTLSGPVSPAASVNDPKDMADSSGDIKNIKAVVKGDNLHLSMSVHGIAAPSVDDTPEGMKNRYYYHWLFDTDNDTATGFKNDAYEGNPTGLANPIGVDLVVQFGWRDGKPNGLAAYDPLVGDDSPLVVDYAFSVSGDTINAVIALSDLKLPAGQSVGFSAFQEGASDGWSVDWVESDSLTLVGGASAPVTSLDDPKDMAETILVPLPKGQNLNAPIEVSLKFAPKLSNDDDVRVTLPKVGSPLLLSNWSVNPDPENRLDFVTGNTSPTNPRPDSSGFAWLKRGGWGLPFLFAALAAFAGGLIVRWGTRSGRYRWDWQNTVGQIFGWLLLLAALGLLGSVATLGVFVDKQFLIVEPGLVFTSSVLKANEALSITVNNQPAGAALYSRFIFLPALVGLAIWILRFGSDDAVVRKGGLLVGWLFIAWTTLMVPNGVHCFAWLAI